MDEIIPFELYFQDQILLHFVTLNNKIQKNGLLDCKHIF